MASQSLYHNFVKLAADMKRASKRKADESDSDDSVDQVTNRGNKLRKKARYVREGQMADPSGPKVYKRHITYNDIYERDIISERPLLYDDDGYQIDSEEDDEEGTAQSEAAQFYPYSNVRIEELLAPLTAAPDLAHHPTLSQPFTSKTLAELTNHARIMLQKERASLWQMKRMLTSFSGDALWIPCLTFETLDDFSLFSDSRNETHEHSGEKGQLSNGEQVPKDTQLLDDKPHEEPASNEAVAIATGDGDGGVDNANENLTTDNDVIMVEASNTNGDSVKDTVDINTIKSDKAGVDVKIVVNEVKFEITKEGENGVNGSQETSEVNKIPSLVHRDAIVDGGSKPEESVEVMTVDDDPDQEQEGEEDNVAPRRMRTRAQAQAASDNTGNGTRSASPESNSSLIHPYFLAPSSAKPDPDIGLPQQEAEETRRLLQLYVQKQEEVCRGIQKLYDGLLKADRLRKTVYKWAKAEGHVGEMSDGEDWYDKDEWGLTEDLKKGQDEEEEDAATTAKKTRTRRQ